MSGKKNRGSARAVPRAYGRLTRHERDTVQRMLERGASCREIARELGRSPSTVSAEVASHRFVTAPKSRRGERVDASADLSAACPRLAAWPRCCNGCGRYRAIGCKRRPHVFYEARAAQLCADSVLVSSRRGIDADEPAAAARLEAIRDCLRRGLSPEQMAARNGGPVDLSPSTIYRWVSAGYDGMTNMELRRKVGYRPRKSAAGRAATRHSARRSHAAFLALGEDACAAAWEMDTVEGAREDSACLLTLLHCQQQAPARAAAGEDRRVRRGRPGRYQGGPRRRRHGQGLPRRAHRQRRRVLRRGGDRGAARRGGRARRGCSTATPGEATRRAPASATTSR